MRLFFFVFIYFFNSLILNAQAENFNGIVLEDSHPGIVETIEEEFINSPIDGYNLYIPKSSKKSSKKYPLLVFLHGGGLVGGSISEVLNYDLPKSILESSSLESELDFILRDSFIVLMPHIRRGQFYEGETAVRTIINRIIQNENVDIQRVYLTGLSRGGHGTWGLGSRMSDVFAAIAPVCGRGDGITNYSNLEDMPIWVTHNTEDSVVPYTASENIVNRLESLFDKSFHKSSSISSAEFRKHNLIFTSNKSQSHNAWVEMHTSVNFFKWLLRFSR